jgi:hypothetical protein
VLHKEREAYEIQKNKKVNDVEIWARALKEEESIAMKEYCQKNGKEEMENIRKAIQEKHAKELLTKKNLESAQGAFSSYKKQLLEQRTKKHQDEQHKFCLKQGQAAKTEILDDANKQLKVIMIRRLNEAAAEERRKRDLERAAKDKASGNETVYDRDDNSQASWSRGTGMADAKKAREELESKQAIRQKERAAAPEDSNSFMRGQNVNKVSDKPKESGPPVFGRSGMKPREQD